MSRIFVVVIEIRPLPGAELDCRTVGGAAVRCFVPATDEDEARARLAATLEADRFELVEVEFCHPYDSTDWSQSDDGSDGARASEAAANNGVVYGTFHTWPANADVT